ncbi:MAG: histidine phosphatase family protein [Bacteroidales bacterium]|nr:histidine phosphatase family protein [Bacteroidales bacterium]
MSKILHIARHAKSSWDYEDISDIDRPLNPRGINNAYLMARRFTEKNQLPDLLIASPANRALHTAVIYARVLKLSWDKIVMNENIYMGYAEEIIQIIKSADNKHDSIMLFGHNPTFTVLANHFLKDQIDNIPTAGIVSITFKENEWEKIGNAAPQKVYFDYPKNI